LNAYLGKDVKACSPLTRSWSISQPSCLHKGKACFNTAATAIMLDQ